MSPSTRWLARCEEHLPAGLDWLTSADAERVAAMRFPKRRTEFLVARWTARQAGRLILGVPDLEVRRHPSGAPEAYAEGRPLEVGISLTHRAGWAVCLLGLEPGAVGCDLELVEPRSAAFVADYFTPAERAFIGEDPLRANLIWSAKESALKVLRAGLRRDTRSVEVTAGPESDGWSPLNVRAVEGRGFPGWWRRCGDFVLTSCAVRRTAPPEAPADPICSVGGVFCACGGTVDRR